MSLLTRLKTGLVLTKDSLLLIRHNPRLGLFPLVSGLAGLAFLVIFLGITFGLMAIQPEGAILVGLVVIYLGLTFISSFFAAALVHQTNAVLHGDEPSLEDGMRAAWDVKWPLFLWSVVAATIGMVINAIENSNSRVAQIFGVIFGVGWTLLTFFVIPVIVFEKASFTGMFKRSAGTFKGTWGETPISLVGIQVVSLLVALPFIGSGILLFTNGFILTGVVLVLVGALFSFLVGQTLQGVVKTVLYIYATEDGEGPAEFDDIDFDNLAGDSRAGVRRPRGTHSGGFH